MTETKKQKAIVKLRRFIHHAVKRDCQRENFGNTSVRAGSRGMKSMMLWSDETSRQDADVERTNER